MHRFILTLSIVLSILVLTAVLSSAAQTSSDTLPEQITCVPGTTVFLQGRGDVGTALLVQFDGVYVGGGSVKPGGIYTIPLNIDPATKAGEYPVVVEVRGTREVIADTTCVVPGAAEETTGTPDPASVDMPAEEADLDANPSSTASPTSTPTRAPTATPASTNEQTETIESTEITIVRAPGRVNRGDTALLEIRTEPITRCSIQVFYPDSPDGEPVVDGLQDQTTDQNGDLSWEWLVEDEVETGTHPIIVTCNDQTAETTITVLD